MAIVGRALREKWAAEADEARHPERAQERVDRRAIIERAWAETKAKFPLGTQEEIEAAFAYRDARIAELEGCK